MARSTNCDLQHSSRALVELNLYAGFSMDPNTRGVLIALIIIGVMFAAGLGFHYIK